MTDTSSKRWFQFRLRTILVVVLVLESLDISGTGITDKGLEYLTGLTNLMTLHIYDTTVTPAGVAKVQEALPNCEINY